jgi:hypothetical protein
LGIDVDRRVRCATHSCHLIIVTKIRKRIAPFLKEIIPIWIISLFDQSKDVAKIANESFQVNFSVYFVSIVGEDGLNWMFLGSFPT